MPNLSKINQISIETEFELSLDPAKSYFIHGRAGVGKTFLALQIAKRNQNWDFINFLELVKTAQNSFGDQHENWLNRERLKELKDDNLLIIDDIGIEKTTDYITQVVYDLINYRYENCLHTIITSNFSLEEIEKKYHERIADRIQGMSETIGLKGESKRKK